MTQSPDISVHLEICIDSLESAIGADRLGADRVELCSDLHLDGLTPANDLIKQVSDALDLGLFIIIRPREGDFHYSPEEVTLMLEQISDAKALGADGIVSGALMPDGSLDVETTRQLIAATSPLPFTFHRAFDVCKEPKKVFAQLDAMGIDRLLTSGQKDTALEGVEFINTLCVANSTIQVMAGSGVNAKAIPALWNAGVRQFHFTSHKKVNGVNVFDEEKMSQAQEVLKELISAKSSL